MRNYEKMIKNCLSSTGGADMNRMLAGGSLIPLDNVSVRRTSGETIDGDSVIHVS